MADAPTTDEVARILTYVAPGFFARVGYTARFPQRQKEHFHTLVVSVAASVPLVALGNLIANVLGVDSHPTKAPYVLVLLGPSIVIGYLVAALRGWERMRKGLRRLGIPFDPEATIYEQTLLKVPYDSRVTIAFKDGRSLTGYPAKGPGVGDDEPRELYVTNPRWWNGLKHKWEAESEWRGAIVNLDEATTIMLQDDPTHPTAARTQGDDAVGAPLAADPIANAWTDADEIRRLDQLAGVLLQAGLAAFVAGVVIATTAHPDLAIKIVLYTGSGLAAVSAIAAGLTLRHTPESHHLVATRRKRKAQVNFALYGITGAIYCTILIVLVIAAIHH